MDKSQVDSSEKKIVCLENCNKKIVDRAHLRDMMDHSYLIFTCIGTNHERHFIGSWKQWFLQ